MTAWIALAATAVAAGEWPQYRGPGRDGSLAAPAALAAWPDGGPTVVWRRPLGPGFSAVTVAGGRLFTLFADGDEELAAAFEPASGKELWRRPIGPRFPETFGDGPRSTPAVDGDTMFALSATGRLVALATADGAPRWQLELTEALGSQQPSRGFATSVLVEGDTLLIRAGGGDGRAFAALDKASGELLWTALDGGPAHTSPIAVSIGGGRQYVFVESKRVVGLSPGGELLWQHPWEPGTIAMPLFAPPDRVFVSASYDVGAALLRVERGADGRFAATEVWRNKVMKNHFNSSVIHDGHVYGFDNATLKCVDLAGGEQRWAKRGLGKGSLIRVGGDLVVLSDRGKLVLVAATPEGYRERASFQALDGKSWTAPAFAGGRLYVRNLAEMAAIELPAAP